MILKKMILKNFRQFQGTQEIEFASGERGNVTVVFGENGRGKTGIYRALLFCLYGDVLLTQDDQVEQSELYLVNVPEMEAHVGDGSPVSTSVKLFFVHEGDQYEIERSLRGMLNHGEVIQESVGVRLVRWDKSGNSKLFRDPKEVKETVNSILSKGLREYFLFDGEKIERLTRASSTQRKEISTGIRKLLDVDTLETSIKAVEKLRKYFDAEVETRASGELARVIKSLRENDDETQRKMKRLSDITDELRIAEEQTKQIDGELVEINSIRDLLEERAELEQKKSEFEEQLHNHLKKMKEHTGRLSLLLVKDTSERVFREIDKKKQRHEIPAEIRSDLIERIIEERKCICGTLLESGSKEFENIISWRSRTPDGATEDSLLDIWRHLSSLNTHFEDIGMNAEASAFIYGQVRSDHSKAMRRLSELHEEIGSSEVVDAANLEKSRKAVERKMIKLEGEQQSLVEESRLLIEERRAFKIQRDELEKEKGVKDEMSRRASLSERTSDALKLIHEEFTGEARDLISQRASSYFMELLDEESKKTLRSILVNPDYSIQVYDHWRKPFLANISAGQRQIMSIAFIAALASVASEADVFEMPLFMDTPFSRLSLEHRKNLIRRVPTWCTQWILLATDTEFSKQEAVSLKKTGEWDKFYMLKGTQAGCTEIVSYEVDQAIGFLRAKSDEV